ASTPDGSVQTASIDPRTIAQVACGDYHTCARLTDGSVRCWGRNRAGEIGDGGAVDRRIPTPVPGVTDVTQIALGATFSCALRGDRTVTCWGSGAILNDARVREHVA